jgi:2-polyprenyl-6-methoxyphenol hydroxylase-like FAD-dependent oxidoreductase
VQGWPEVTMAARRSAGTGEVLVVGGGIGGLTAALAMARAGLGVRVLERAGQFAELGAGLQMAPNASRVLDRLGILQRVIEAGVLPRRLALRSALTGRELAALDVGGRFRRRYGAPYVVLHRSDLLAILVDACAAAGVSLHPGKDVLAVTDHGDRVCARCADGTAYRGIAAIAADGLHSRLREMFSDDAPVCSGFVAYRGTIDISQENIGEVTRCAALDEVVAWIGPGLHFVQYALCSGTVCNRVAVFRSRQYAAGEQDWGTPGELDDVFSACCPQVRTAMTALWRDRRWPMYDREPIGRWARGRVALLGDAAHPMLQYLAQGACQAIEDAYVLAGKLACCAGKDGSHLVPKALAEYEQARAPQAMRVQRTARLWGDIWHIDGAGAVLRDELFAYHRPGSYRYTDWLYGPVTEREERA